MGYKNFDVAIYCRVNELNNINDLDVFQNSFQFIEKHLKISKVYLETFRGGETIEKEKIIKIKNFFKSKGIKTSGGITALPELEHLGFNSMCYSNEDHRNILKSVVEFTAGIFDEIIFDDFYFTNCKCKSCISGRAEKNWAEYRLELMKNVSEELVIKPAKQVNPNINMIIKYPNWYDHYQETGYNLEVEPTQFDMIYSGTETRDPQHTQQHLPRYLSYFIMRYLENVKPGKNGGGWFDPYECNYNLGSYVEQAYLTLFGKAKEVTLFCLGSLLEDGGSIFIPMAGHVFNKLDESLGYLGNPVGTACYIPYHSSGENFLHNYIGMLGIPLEPFKAFPAESKNIFLTESSAEDKELVHKIETSLLKGGNVVITSGLLRALQDKGLKTIANIYCTDKKAEVQKFAISGSGISFTDHAVSEKAITIPQIQYCTNDAWQLVAGLGKENNFPILLKVNYGEGQLLILTMPDDFGDLYYYPREVLDSIRKAFAPVPMVSLDALSKVGLFTYDNDTFIVESFLPYPEDVIITINKACAKLVNIENGLEISGFMEKDKTIFKINVQPTSYKIFKIV